MNCDAFFYIKIFSTKTYKCIIKVKGDPNKDDKMN